MPTYERCGRDVIEMANEILCRHETHKPVLDAKVRIDFLWASEINHHGRPANGQCRKIGLKDRVAGRGDAEILIDVTWWGHAKDAEREALLDHELHHIEVDGSKRDSAGRPVIKLRNHDVEIGWFAIIAERNGRASGEQEQARYIFDRFGQAFWPAIAQVLGVRE